MNGITSMQRSSTSYADYGKFASGKKVNRAADGAAELAIIQKQETQTRSYKAGENKSPLNVNDSCFRRFVFKAFLCGSHTDKFPVFNADCLCVFFFLIAFIYFSVK